MEQKDSPTYYIGISSGFHDGAIALVNENGEIIFAEATERFTQNKRSLSIVADNYFLSEKIIKHYNIFSYEIAVNWKMYSNTFKNAISAVAIHSLRKFSWPRVFIAKYMNLDINLFSSVADFQASSQFAMLSTVGSSFKYALQLNKKLTYKSNYYFDHHTCHSYYAYFTSNVTKATILIIDGNGDNHVSTSVFVANMQNIHKTYTNKSGASLGDFYGEITKWCGFSEISGEQWKVMGMSSYGKINQELLNDLKKWYSVNELSINKHKNQNQENNIKKNISTNKYLNLEKEDIAYTCQYFYESLLISFINNLYKKYPSDNLIIAGGCALNSAANGKIHTQTPYKNVLIQSAPADDGCAIGAALLNFKKHNPNKTIPHFQTNPYLGFEILNDDVQNFLKHSGYHFQKLDYESIYKITANYLQNGNIIAWVQGRAEFGPRALGNRSILANPCLSNMKDKINSEVKFREEFRPFAPSIKEENANDYFENYHETPYMERVLQIKPEKQHLIPAVTHIDGSGRLQTVTPSFNNHFYNLISAFEKLSGVPIILNTSLNVMGKPIVNSMSDIAAVFSSSGIDVLVVNNYIIVKPHLK